MKALSIFTFFTMLTMGNFAVAGSTRIIPAQSMTCAQVIATYQKYKRIYVIAHGKNIVPIYGLTPIQEERSLRCFRDNGKVYDYIKTVDVKRCIYAAHCFGK